MIKQSFLDSLEGMPVKMAEQKVKTAGYQVEVVPEECNAVTMQARPNTIILWQEAGLVSQAQAGDGLELED